MRLDRQDPAVGAAWLVDLARVDGGQSNGTGCSHRADHHPRSTATDRVDHLDDVRGPGRCG
jgi:hypothetical protein